MTNKEYIPPHVGVIQDYLDLESLMNRNMIQAKILDDGYLAIKYHISDIIEPGKEMYSLFNIRRQGTTQFSSRHFELLSLEEYQEYFNKITCHDDLLRMGEEYDKEVDERLNIR